MGDTFVGGAYAGTDVILFSAFGAGGEAPVYVDAYGFSVLFVAVGTGQVEGRVGIIRVVGDYGHDTPVAVGSGTLLAVDRLAVVVEALFVRGDEVAPGVREEMNEDTLIFDDDIHRSLRETYLRLLMTGGE